MNRPPESMNRPPESMNRHPCRRVVRRVRCPSSRRGVRVCTASRCGGEGGRRGQVTCRGKLAAVSNNMCTLPTRYSQWQAYVCVVLQKCSRRVSLRQCSPVQTRGSMNDWNKRGKQHLTPMTCDPRVMSAPGKIRLMRK
eukprot:4410708-Pyramimonas_sp.AAC.1